VCAEPCTSSQTTVKATAVALPGVPSGSTATFGTIWSPAAFALAVAEARIPPVGDTTR
jgi:hypothetical protein